MHRGATRRRRRGGGTQPQKVRCRRWLWGRAALWRGAATLTHANLSSPGRKVINYWAVYTWDRLSFIECHTPDLGNKSLDPKQTRCCDAFRLLMSGWQLSLKHGGMLTRNEQTSSNKQTTTPWSISETNDRSHLKANITADGRLVLQSLTKRFSSRLRPQLACTFVHSAVLLKWWPFSIQEIHVLNKKKCTDKQSLFPLAVFCLHILYRSRSLQLQEAFIMSLARGGKSQYSKNKNGFETWGAFKYCTIALNTTRCQVSCCSLFTCVWNAVPLRDTVNQLYISVL